MDGDTEKTSIGWALQRTVRPNSGLGGITTGNFPIDETGWVPGHFMNLPELMLAMMPSLD